MGWGEQGAGGRDPRGHQAFRGCVGSGRDEEGPCEGEGLLSGERGLIKPFCL